MKDEASFPDVADDASLVNVLPRSPFASKNVKTNGPGMAANPPSTPPEKPDTSPIGA